MIPAFGLYGYAHIFFIYVDYANVVYLVLLPVPYVLPVVVTRYGYVVVTLRCPHAVI